MAGQGQPNTFIQPKIAWTRNAHEFNVHLSLDLCISDRDQSSSCCIEETKTQAIFLRKQSIKVHLKMEMPNRHLFCCLKRKEQYKKSKQASDDVLTAAD
eukprot:1145324-Pelagomonas_calceolata.AAC.4